MRIAVCFCGQPRNWKKGIDTIRQHFDKYRPDYFAHTYWHESLVGTPYNQGAFSGDIVYRVENNIEELKNSLEFKKFVYEKPTVYEIKRQYVVNTTEHDRHIRSIKGKYESLAKVLSYLEEDYDFVVLTRYDIDVMCVPSLHTMSKQEITIGNYHVGRKYIFNDNFWIIGRECRDAFDNIFDGFDETYDAIINKKYTFEQWERIKDTELAGLGCINGEEFTAIRLLLNGYIDKVVKNNGLKYLINR